MLGVLLLFKISRNLIEFKGRVNPKLRLSELRVSTEYFTINLWQTIYQQTANELKNLKNILLGTKTVLLLATRQLKWLHAVLQ